MHKRLISVALIIGLAALPACGAKSDAPKGLAFVPANADLVIAIDNPSDWSAAKKANALKFARSFSITEAQSAAGFDEFLDREFSHGSNKELVSYAKDVRPWLAGSIITAWVPLADDPTYKGVVDQKKTLFGHAAGRVTIIPSKNDSAAKKFLSKTLDAHKALAGEVFDGFLIGVDGRSICAACSEAEAHDKAAEKLNEIKNAKRSESIEMAASFKDLKTKGPNENDAFVYVKTNVGSAAGSEVIDPQAKALIECYSEGLLNKQDSQAMFLTVAVDENEVNVSAVGKSVGNATTGSMKVLSGLPDSTILAAGYNGLGTQLIRVFDCMAEVGQAETIESFERQSGFSFDQDLFSAMKGESVLAIGDITAKEFGIVSVADESAGKNLVAKLHPIANQFAPAYDARVTKKQSDVYSIYLSAIAPDVTFGFKNGRFAFAGSFNYFERLTEISANPLSSTEAFKKLVKTSGDNQAAFFFQPDLAAEKWGSFIRDADTRKAWRSIDAIGGIASGDGDLSKAEGGVIFKNS